MLSQILRKPLRKTACFRVRFASMMRPSIVCLSIALPIVQRFLSNPLHAKLAVFHSGSFGLSLHIALLHHEHRLVCSPCSL